MIMTLYNGVSGIKTHQFGLDSWSNNIANVNTNGYRQNLPEFNTIFAKHMEYINTSSTVSSDMEHGVTVGSNAIDTRSGSYISADDSEFNVAISGGGWLSVGKNKDGEFSLTDPTAQQTQNTFFTRNGAFNRDSEGYIVNAEGYYLYGIDLGKIAEDGVFTSDPTNEGITGTNLKPLQIPKDIYFKPVQTSTVDIALNLNKNSNYTSMANYTESEDGYDAQKFGAVDLGALTTSDGDKIFNANDKTITIQLYDGEGNETSSTTLTYGTDFKTIGELMAAINTNAGVNMQMNEETGCETTLSGTEGAEPVYLSFSGQIAENLNLPTAMTEVVGGAMVAASPTLQIPTLRLGNDVYDETGRKYTLENNFFLTTLGEDGADTWDVTSGIYSTQRELVSDSKVSGTMTFDAEGVATYSGESSLTYDGGTITFDLTKAGDLATSNYAYMDSEAKRVEKDGSPEGRLAGVSIDSNGVINLSFSNGKFEAMGRVGMADFINDQGLSKISGNLFQMVQQRVNGGEPQTSSGMPIVMWDEVSGQLKNSSVLQGMLESSNVDLTVALTELIIMQRGYSANAKSITTGDEMLKEAIGLKR